MTLFVGRVCGIRDEPSGRCGQVSVRGALREVALELVPDARLGDSVLVEAGVALSVLRGEDGEEQSTCA